MAGDRRIGVRSLIEVGAHFGHQKSHWNPKMKDYIFGVRGDIHIIDLKKTLISMDRVYSYVYNLAKNGKAILFAGTKRQAKEAIENAATRCGMPYVSNRWLGGMLTNFSTIRTRVNYMKDLEAQEKDGSLALLPKKEQAVKTKELEKLQANLDGVRDLVKLPDAVFIVDTSREDIAVREANRLGIPIIGTLDTNCDPDTVTYGIPMNDDAIRSVTLICDFIADAVLAGQGRNITAEDMENEPQAEAEAELETEQEKLAESGSPAGEQVAAEEEGAKDSREAGADDTSGSAAANVVE